MNHSPTAPSKAQQRLDIAVGVHVSKCDPDVGAGDQGVRLRYTCGGTGKNVVWIWMVGLEGLERLRSSSSLSKW